MLEFVGTGADQVVGIRIEGKVTTEDIERAMREIEHKLDEYEQVSFIVEMKKLSGISPGALLKDISYGFQQLPNLQRFHRAAVVSDKKWLRAAVKLEAKVLPGFDIKAFYTREREEAYDWVKSSMAASTRERL